MSATRREVLGGVLGLVAERSMPVPPVVSGPLPLPEWPGQVVRPVAFFRCGPQPKSIAFSPDGEELWVTFLGGPPSVGVYAAASGRELATIRLGGHGAVEVLFRADGRTAWVSQMETHTVHEIDARARSPRRSFDTQSDWSKVIEASPDGTTLYVSNWNLDDVSVIDLVSGETAYRIPTVKTPRGLYATRDGTGLYVAGFGDGVLERIDLDTFEAMPCFTGRALRHVACSPHERFLFVTDMAAHCLWRYDLEEEVVVRLAETDSHPNTCAVTPDGRIVAVSNRGPNGRAGYLADGPAWGSVLLIDSATGEVLDSIIGGDQCTALAISPDGRRLAFSDFRDDTVRVYEIPPYPLLRAAGWPRRDLHSKDLWKHR